MAALSTIALLAVSAAGTATTAIEQQRAAKAAQKQGDFEGGLFELNAALADADAQDVLERGAQAAGQVRRSARLLGGAQRAAYAGQGVDALSGSARDVMLQDAALSEIEATTIANNAAREAWGHRVEGIIDRSQAGYARAAGRNRARALRQQSYGTLLSGAGELANLWDSAPKGVNRGNATGDYGSSTYGGGMFGTPGKTVQRAP